MPNFELMRSGIKFGKQPEEAEADEAPKPKLIQAEVRRFAALREAIAILDVIPTVPRQSLHAIMTGRYDLADLIGVMIKKLGSIKVLRIATLSISERNCNSMAKWLDTKSVGEIRLLISHFWAEHNRDDFAALNDSFACFPGCKLAASRSHCKVIGMEFESGKYILEGSANLRTNSNWEQFCLVLDPELHDWHSTWIDEQIEKYAL